MGAPAPLHAGDDDTMKLGLLMESAQTHQRSIEESLERLRAHTQGIDALVRDEIRRTLVEELRALSVASRHATQVLQDMSRAANLRTLLWGAGMATLHAAIPSAIVWWTLPTQPQMAALRSQRDALASNIAGLEERGGRVDWRRCGDAKRLCVRVERQGPTYGETADYFVLKGY